MATSLKSQYVHHAKYDYDIDKFDPPPPYEFHAPQETRTAALTTSNNPESTSSSSTTALKPIVIPQVTKAFGGAFASPFARAYAPSLERHGISEYDFLTFIDGLNEAFIANPAFQAVGLVGGLVGFVPLGTAQLVGTGVSIASGFVSAGVSYARARAFVKKTNSTLFIPKGLKVTVKTTKDMMATVGADGERLQLPPLDEYEMSEDEFDAVTANEQLSDHTHPDDPRLRRVRALHGLVEDLTFDVPESESSENWLKRMGEWQANHKASKQQAKMMKRRDKAHEKAQKRGEDVGGESRKADKEIRKVQREMDKTLEKAEREVAKEGRKDGKVEKVEKERDKKMRELEKDMAKAVIEKDKKVGGKHAHGSKHINKADRKEQRAAQKIRWVVIIPSGNESAHDEDVN